MVQRRQSNTKPGLTLVIGGASSGKTAFALALARTANPKAFVATGEPLDREMAVRIRRHQQRRGRDWDTAEVPVAVPTWMRARGSRYRVIVLDCLTLWLSNLLGRGRSSAAILQQTTALLKAIQQTATRVIIVTNELGLGPVPVNRVMRRFRQLAGEVNQLVSAEADEVYAVISGIPIRIKSGNKASRRVVST